MAHLVLNIGSTVLYFLPQFCHRIQGVGLIKSFPLVHSKASSSDSHGVCSMALCFGAYYMMGKILGTLNSGPMSFAVEHRTP